MGELLCAEKLCNPCTIPIEKGLAERVIYLCHHNILKKKAMGHFSETLITATAADVNRSCGCSDFSEGSDSSAKCNEYYGLFPFSVLPGLFCIPEQYCRAIAIRSDPLLSSDLGCVIYQTIHTFDPLLGALEITPANTVRSTCPASSSGAQPQSFPPL